MIKHIVMWRIKETIQNKDAVALEIKKRLESLNGKILTVRWLEVGININQTENAADVVLYSEFGSRESLAEYQANPLHQQIAAFVKENTVERRIVDYER